MFCSECGKQVADNAKFCGECGAAQADVELETLTATSKKMQSCPSCNAKGWERGKQCRSCGYIHTEATAIINNCQALPTNTSSSGNDSIMAQIGIFVAIGAILIFAFGYFGTDKNRQALNEFKNSSEGTALNTCVGPAGTIDWSIYSSKEHADNIKVIEAKMKKGDKSFLIQYLYNVDTKVFELAYLSADDKPTSKLIGGIELASFCPGILF